MRKSPLLYTAFGLIIVLGLLHFVAETFYLYWMLWWFDIMMHLLAGFSGGLVIMWFVGSSNKNRSLFITLASVLTVGVGWEIFEYVYDLAQPIDYKLDTIFDLINDGIGAVLAYYYTSE